MPRSENCQQSKHIIPWALSAIAANPTQHVLGKCSSRSEDIYLKVPKSLTFATLRVLALVIVFIGFIFSMMAAGSCEFIQYSDLDGEEGAFGLFTYTNPAGSCTRYREVVFNITDKTARVGAIGGAIFALVSLLLQLVDILCWRVFCGKCCESCLLLLAMIFQGLTFAAFASDNYCLFVRGKCSISNGGIFSIVAFCLYFIGGVVGCFTPEPRPILCRDHHKEASSSDDDEESSGIDEEAYESADEHHDESKKE